MTHVAQTKLIPLDELLLLPSIQNSIKFHTYNINKRDQQDLIQDFYLAIIKAYDSITDPSSAEAFCHSVIRQQKFNYYRAKKRNIPLMEMDTSVENDEGDTMEDILLQYTDISYELIEVIDEYSKLRDKFTATELTVLDAVLIERRFNPDYRGEVTVIAEEFGCTKAHVSKTLKKLKNLLSK